MSFCLWHSLLQFDRNELDIFLTSFIIETDAVLDPKLVFVDDDQDDDDDDALFAIVHLSEKFVFVK